MNNIKNNWLCVYIYCIPPFERLLVDCILPIIEELILTKQIEHFFFIRYGENGPHIRLRMNFNNTKLLEQNKNNVFEKLLDFIKVTRSSYKQISQSVIETNYEPEYKRYGGNFGITIAEKIFHSSSLHVFKLIKIEPKWSYNNVLYNSLIMNLVMMIELVEDSNKLRDFYLLSFHNWFPFRYYNYEQKVLDIARKDECLKSYYYLFEKNKNQLLPLINSLLNKNYKHSLSTIWCEEIRLIKSKYNAAIKQVIKNCETERELYSIYDSYCHMNNNRLGMRNSDESLISFWVLQSLITIYGKRSVSDPQ
ncbi:MAG: thiopeptide-type bacteriocin biosynthesis protein [Bacteroidia bacterium]